MSLINCDVTKFHFIQPIVQRSARRGLDDEDSGAGANAQVGLDKSASSELLWLTTNLKINCIVMGLFITA